MNTFEGLKLQTTQPNTSQSAPSNTTSAAAATSNQTSQHTSMTPSSTGHPLVSTVHVNLKKFANMVSGECLRFDDNCGMTIPNTYPCSVMMLNYMFI